jgi:TIR domain-containing protein
MSRKPDVAPEEVFLSHSSADLKFTARLAKALAGHGVKTFVSRQHILGAQEWHDEIGAALKRCDWFLVILSPSAVRSTWVKHELIYALQDSRYKERILPILYKKCDPHALSWTLAGFRGSIFDPTSTGVTGN